MYKTALITLLATSLTVTGCSEQSEPASTDTSATKSETPAWILSEEPASAVSVVAAKAEAAEGQEIVVRGRIGGRKEPITEGSPVFTIIDMKLPHCGEIPGDSCKTPWDYCCETPEDITANAATVRLTSGDPKLGGLSELDEVVITGTVGPRPNDEVLMINATGIYVAEKHGG